MRSCFNPRSPCGERRSCVSTSDSRSSVSTHAPLAGSDSTARRAAPRRPSFNPRSPCGERLVELAAVEPALVGVSTHAPLAGSDSDRLRRRLTRTSFNPRSPCGERLHKTRGQIVLVRFQPTLPLREATWSPSTAMWRSAGFNPRSPCGERRLQDVLVVVLRVVSTHAPLAGSDDREGGPLAVGLDVSTHAPLAGSDPRRRPFGCGTGCFNPRSPCGERRARAQAEGRAQHVSTHAPLAGSDRPACPSRPFRCVSTHAPLAGSDGVLDGVPHVGSVSTHAPLAGSDDALRITRSSPAMFQPTLPLRGATRAHQV